MVALVMVETNIDAALTEVLISLGVSAPIVGAIWATFNWFDRRLRSDSRRALARLVVGLPGNAEDYWRTHLMGLFNRVFGKTVLTVQIRGSRISISIPRFGRSIVASLIMVTLLSLIFVATSYKHYLALIIALQDKPELADAVGTILIGIMGTIAIFYFLFNIVADYLSLIESKLILWWVLEKFPSKNAPILKLLSFVIIDFLFTTSIVLLLIWSVDYIVEEFFLAYVFDSLRTYLIAIKEAAVDGEIQINEFSTFFFDAILLFFRGDDGHLLNNYFQYLRLFVLGTRLQGFFGIFILSTYVTCMWTLVLVIGIIIARILRLAEPLFRFLNTHFHILQTIAKNPLKILGRILIFLVLACLLGWRLY